MNKIALLWDLDGTLIDSYETIVSSLYDAIAEYNIFIDKEYILESVKKGSVGSFLDTISEKYDLPIDMIYARTQKLNFDRRFEIKPIKNICKLLDYTISANISNYIYTHKGRVTYSILDNLDIRKYFKEILTIENRFARKPNPEAVNYLIKKYDLNRESTYYIGDRKLDIECGCNAGIKTILYLPQNSYVTPTGKETYIVEDMLEIIDLL